MSLLTCKEVAAKLKLSPRQIWKMASAGRLPGPVRLGRSVRWRVGDIDEWVRLGCVSRDEFEAAVMVEARQ